MAGKTSKAGLARLWEVSERTIERYIAAGMPFEEDPDYKGLRAKHVLDIKRCDQWLTARRVRITRRVQS